MDEFSSMSKPKVKRSKKASPKLVAPVAIAPKPVVCEEQVAINVGEELACTMSRVRHATCLRDVSLRCADKKQAFKRRLRGLIGSVAAMWKDSVSFHVDIEVGEIIDSQARQRRMVTRVHQYVVVTRDPFVSLDLCHIPWRKRSSQRVEHTVVRLFCEHCARYMIRRSDCQNMACGERYQHTYVHTITRLKKNAQMQGEARNEARDADVESLEALNPFSLYGEHRGGRKSVRNGGRKRNRQDVWARAEQVSLRRRAACIAE